MSEKEIEDVVINKGWCYNSVTRWLVVTNTTPYALSQMCGVDKSVVSRWTHTSDLPAFVHWAFLAFGKLALSGVNVRDYF